ncbi:Guanine nucleotide exchange factor for Cdc42p [Stygiomarasmius scandens]|uniref:Guanine nucleotide exchange factor for Cdc42p n=1 Tax=Marasmiellus scandens TaxID=2682957 RepID=A0ABR1K4Z7_9AGAR
MASTVSSRKKSIVSSAIETPIANNTLLNQAAITSLYQECSRLRSRLIHIRGFSKYFQLVNNDARQSTDPVTQLWDLFSYGIPLCYIFDQLPDDFNKINNSEFNKDQYEANPDRAKKHGIAVFAMQVRNDKVAQNIPECEPFTVTDLWDRGSTDGLVKVIKTVKAIVNHLPPEAFEDAPPSPPYLASHDSYSSLSTDPHTSLPPANAQEAARNNIVREMVETERKYVQDLEIMQKYSTALSQSNIIDQDTIHLLFPNLNKLLNFQRKFLIKLESTAELPWVDQQWGLHFLESEDEFIVYEPYCANYTSASDLMLVHEQSLAALNHLINVKGELPAFLIKPIQRVCKYPLLLDSLIKASNPEDYPYYDELKAGSDAAKRITDKINEAQRQAENEQTVKNLAMRVDDWKGHHLENFGQLLLDDIFIVTKSDIDREYHVFLFEKIILCCKEALPPPPNGKKVGKSNSILKKQSAPPTPGIPGSSTQKKTTPLLLKGRIFLGNVTKAEPQSPRNSTSSLPPQYPLAVWWKGDDDVEYFTLRCRSEEQRQKWESVLVRLITEAKQRRASERAGMSRLASVTSNSTNPRLNYYNGVQPGYPMSGRPREDYETYGRATPSNIQTGPQGYPPHEGFDMEAEEDDYEDYPPASSSYAPSGRGTPMGRSPYGDRESFYRDDRERARAYTENGMRPITPRINGSAASDASFGHGARPRPPLRSQFSSTKLRSTYDSSGDYRQSAGIPPTPAPMHNHSNSTSGNPVNRSRSASQPQAYNPNRSMHNPPPPLPTSVQWKSSNASMTSSKRGSGSSQSTGGDSSDYSPNSSSPITPYGSSESSLAGVGGLRTSRSQTFEQTVAFSSPISQPVKVKVHYHEDIFVIQVSRMTEYEELVEKVGKKIRLCGPRRDDGPLRVKYRDEDGDMVSLGSTEDVQMAFEQYRPGGQVTLFVT